MTTYYTTKYALSRGVETIDADDNERNDDRPHVTGGYLYALHHGDWNWTLYRIGREAFTDKTEALHDAKKRRDKKAAALEKQAAKLRTLEFP